jgi:hypothetical protein
VVRHVTWSGTKVDDGSARFQYTKPLVHLLQLERRSGPQALLVRLGDSGRWRLGKIRRTVRTFLT